MTDENQPTDADRAVDNDNDAEANLAGEQARDDEQEVAIDAVVAEGEKDPEPAGDDQQ